MLCRERRFAFLHIPKTGGTAVRRALGGWREPVRAWLGGDGYKHDTARRARELYGEDVLERYFTFCFVRNPWERLVSHYCYHREGRGSARARSTIAFCRRHGFREFVLESTNRDVWQEPQLDGITLEDGRVAVDFAGRFERLQDDFEFVCRRLGIARPRLLPRNRSHHPDYTTFYDPVTRERVARLHARDIEAFGYRFGD